jgi:hypothetical protein
MVGSIIKKILLTININTPIIATKLFDTYAWLLTFVVVCFLVPAWLVDL